ncbi:hypothetical protein WJX82_001691 [Trebouxia sp. C0006]
MLAFNSGNDQAAETANSSTTAVKSSKEALRKTSASFSGDLACRHSAGEVFFDFRRRLYFAVAERWSGLPAHWRLTRQTRGCGRQRHRPRKHGRSDGSAHFEPQTSYIDHYPQQELPVHTPQPAAPVTGVPFTASTEYNNQYVPKSLAFNQIETTNQQFYPYWSVPPPQKKGYAVRRISAAPALDFAGDNFTTTNAVEYQPKPCSYVRPTGVTVVQPLSEACDKHTTYNSFFQAKPTEGFIRVPRGSSPAPAPFTATTTYDNEFQEKPLPHELPHLSDI